jgi:hypothetical protein
MENPGMDCTVDGCGREAVVTVPIPLCSVDALRVAAATEERLETDAKMTRVQALVEILTASPAESNADLAARTGWPAQWVRSHRKG